MFVISRKETDIPIVPESEADFSLEDHIALLLSEVVFGVPGKRRDSDSSRGMTHIIAGLMNPKSAHLLLFLKSEH
jgi:hypothetical protein